MATSDILERALRYVLDLGESEELRSSKAIHRRTTLSPRHADLGNVTSETQI